MASSQIVTLNIGGVHFCSTYSTLASVPGSMLAAFLDRWTEGTQNELFIDRDGKHFGCILNYLRDGENVILPDDLVGLEELKREASYYLLEGLEKLIDTKIQHTHQSVQLNIGGMRYATTSDRLRSVPGSLLDRYMDEWTHGQEIFIDRDGTLFTYIIDYLRNGPDCKLPKDAVALEELKEEAKIYELPDLVQLMEERRIADMKASPEYVEMELSVGDGFEFCNTDLLPEEPCLCNTTYTKVTKSMCEDWIPEPGSPHLPYHTIDRVPVTHLSIRKEYATCVDAEHRFGEKYHLHKAIVSPVPCWLEHQLSTI